MRVFGLKKRIVMLRIIWATIIGALKVTLSALFYRKNRRYYMNKQVHAWNQKMLQIVAVKFKVFNPHHFTFQPGRSYIIMSNHLSHYDIPLIFATFPGESVRMIAKKELFRIPVFGWGIWVGECVSIDRKNHRQAAKDLERAKQKIKSGIRMWIAPEGTRSRSGELGPFKKGGFKLALDTQAIIVPVTIIGSNKILPPGTFDFSVGESIEMHVGEPIDTTKYQLKDLLKLMDKVRAEIQGYL